jgi:hypothetical protein
MSARRKQKDRRAAVFLFVLEDQAQHGEKVGDHVAVHESVAGPKRHLVRCKDMSEVEVKAASKENAEFARD